MVWVKKLRFISWESTVQAKRLSIKGGVQKFLAKQHKSFNFMAPMSDDIVFGILYDGVVVSFLVMIAQLNTTMTGFDSCDSCLKFIEHKNEDGSLLTVDTGERCLGFCEDLDPDDKVYKVQENLFISSQDGAQNKEELRRNNITHILNVGTGITNAFPEVVLKICWSVCVDLSFLRFSRGGYH